MARRYWAWATLGPAAALPVMEGKAALFKRFAGVDAWPVCLDTQDTEKIIEIVKAIAPVYGGINLEDIAAPRCFEIEARLRDELDIPVFHDDQHGTAIVVLAALTNALRVVGKQLSDVRIVVSGVGAAGHAIIELLHAQGAGRHRRLRPKRAPCTEDRSTSTQRRQWIADHTNRRRLRRLAARGPGRGRRLHRRIRARTCSPATTSPRWPRTPSSSRSPTPTRRSTRLRQPNTQPSSRPVVRDYPNQINNVLAFPGLFRGMLDAGAHKHSVTELPGASYFHDADSFAMMRGGHLDVCVLGAFQVSAGGDLANWHTGNADAIPAVGGAMDLAIGAKQTFVMMTLLTRDGRPKLLPECSMPLTGVECVSRVYTGPRRVPHRARRSGRPRPLRHHLCGPRGSRRGPPHR